MIANTPPGDELLRQVSKRLRSFVRSVDTVARLGGDEFAVLLRGSASADDARRIASLMIDTVGAVYELNGHAVSIGLSVGIALAPVHADAAETLLSQADRALYAAKAAGRGRFHLAEALPGTEAPGDPCRTGAHRMNGGRAHPRAPAPALTVEQP